ncbi:hypothetical protein [Ralstonia sp. RL]|uniref:hypothetical protein n=1 Tax=Ralstonia sp. RL TaxID=1839756 RepID=UPI0025806CEB|nr:hypothetical protein [Ralstonia sp. RL]
MTQGEPAGAAALPAQDAGGKKPGLEEIQRRLAAMMANGRTPSLQEVDAVLADLQRNQGKNNVAGVDLAALRENLARAAEIQRLAKEMETLSRQPGKPDLPRMQALLAQIQQQQAGLRMDVGTKPAQPASGR